MEYTIIDLLDGLSDIDLDIRTDACASSKKIKALTLKKIHPEAVQKRRGLSTLSKALLIAAVIAALAIPVAAACGFHFADWLEGMFASGGGYDNDLMLGSGSKNWEVSGYLLDVSAENASNGGLTLVCREWGGGEKEGTLTADDSFWLEKWNGSSYEKLSPQSPPPEGQEKTVAPMETATWQVSWSGSYGTLESGSYRIGKAFTYTSPDGNTQVVELYAKFRVFAEDMAPYVERCRAALEELRTRDSYHGTNTQNLLINDPQNNENYYIVTTVWKSGDDYLVEDQYLAEDGTLLHHRGYLMLGGKGYALSWKGDNVLSGIASWKTVDFLDESQRDMWMWGFEIFDSMIGEVYAEEDRITLIQGWQGTDGKPEYSGTTYVMDEQGRLTSAEYMATIPSPEEFDQGEAEYALEVHDTSPDEIAAVIAAQDVSKPVSFSWEEEKAKYAAGGDGVKTDGFVNTTAQTVTMDNVVALAQKECTLEWQNVAVVYYDETAQVWKVVLSFSQNPDIPQTVYLSNSGITLLVVTE